MYFVTDLAGIVWQCVGFLPAVFPNLTCSAESGISQRNLKGSESPWESAERGLAWSSYKGEKKNATFYAEGIICGM